MAFKSYAPGIHPDKAYVEQYLRHHPECFLSPAGVEHAKGYFWTSSTVGAINSTLKAANNAPAPKAVKIAVIFAFGLKTKPAMAPNVGGIRIISSSEL